VLFNSPLYKEILKKIYVENMIRRKYDNANKLGDINKKRKSAAKWLRYGHSRVNYNTEILQYTKIKDVYF